jgi:hypothetical protein
MGFYTLEDDPLWRSLNVTNHNRIVSSVLVTNGQVMATSNRTLPVTPTDGMAFEF